MPVFMCIPKYIPKKHRIFTSTRQSSFSKIPNIFNGLARHDMHNNAKLSKYNTLQNNDSPGNDALKSVKTHSQINHAGKFKHYPPANKEWFNSVYAYNNNITKTLPSLDKTLGKLIKSYFNAYSRKLEKKVKKSRSRRFRVRRAKLSTNRILVSRAQVKHTSDRVIVTVYVYNSEKKYYLNKLKKIYTINKVGKLLLKGWTVEERLKFLLSKFNKYVYHGLTPGEAVPSDIIRGKVTVSKLFSFFSQNFNKKHYVAQFPKSLLAVIKDLNKNKNKNKDNVKKEQEKSEQIQKALAQERDHRISFIDYIGPHVNSNLIKMLSKKVLAFKSKIQFQEKSLHAYLNKNSIDFNKSRFITTSKVFEKSFIQMFTSKLLRKEIVSVYFKQLIRFNKIKFEDRYVSFLINEVSKIYNRKVEFNFVNLKYLYLSGSIFSSTLVAKIKNRKNRFLKVLKNSLHMFNLPPVNRRAIYDEIYNRKKLAQNIGIKNVFNSNYINNRVLVDNGNDTAAVSNSHNNCVTQDVPHNNEHRLLGSSKQNVDILDESLLNVIPETGSSLIEKIEIPFIIQHADRLNSVMSNLKYKSVKGVRIELAGRLTKRNTAARSLFKLRYKGNLKDTDSSDKGLSAVMLRGHAKSNAEFIKNRSKIRIGSYGFKGWVSTS